MKIALIRRQYSATGGAELYLQRLLNALVHQGHAVHLLTESWCEDADGIVVHAIPTEGTRATRARCFAENVIKELGQHVFDCVFSLERTLKQDVYRAGDGLHCVWLQRRRQFAPWWRKIFLGMGGFHRGMLALEKLVFQPENSRHVIVNSEMVKDEILRHYHYPSDRIHLVRNGIDIKRFQSGNRHETRNRFGISEREFLCLFVGSGWERKGLRYVLGAMQNLSKHPEAKIRVLVVGKGSIPSGVPEGVVFAGPMKDVENAYAAADLLVFPPIYEPSSNVVIEALASGLPVVTSAYNGAGEWIRENETGNVIQNPADVAAIENRILYWHQKGRRVQLNVQEMSLERNVAQTMVVLERAANELKKAGV